MRVESTPAVAEILRRVRADGRDDLVLVLGTGCCDSTAPYLYDHYLPEPDSEPVGEVEGVAILAPAWLARLYEGDATLVLDLEAGVLNDSFSLESEYDCRLTLRAPAAEPRR